MLSLNYKLRPGISILLCLFHCALLIHLASTRWYSRYTTLLVFCMVCIQFLNYRRWWPAAVSIAACTVMFLPRVPRLANHFNIELIGGLIILVLLACRILGLKHRIKPVTITYTIRCTLIALYFITGFHKLNSGFFNADGSCVSHISFTMFDTTGTLPLPLVRITQFFTLMSELVLPFGLLHYRTRKPALFLFVFFHFYLSLCSFVNFSSFAVFLLIGSYLNLEEDYSYLKKDLKIYMAVCIIAALPTQVTGYVLGRHNFMILQKGFVYSIGYVFLFRALFYKTKAVRQACPAPLIPALAVTAISLWGLQSYVGLSTARTLNMYSNVVTEKSRNNHLIIDTKKTKIWGFEEDYVTIVRMPKGAKWYGPLTPQECDIPLIEFKRMARSWTRRDATASCTIRYKGKLLDITNLRESEFSQTKWWHRFLFYRPIPKEGTNPCLW